MGDLGVDKIILKFISKKQNSSVWTEFTQFITEFIVGLCEHNEPMGSINGEK
jgi:hypothetical protein